MKETRHIIEMMKTTGNRAGIIALWKRMMELWAISDRGPDGAAVKAWLPLWQPRPFYTAEELAPMWPALAIATGFTSHWPAVLKSARRLENELDFCGLPRLGHGYQKYFIVERIHYWRQASKEEIEREIENAFG